MKALEDLLVAELSDVLPANEVKVMAWPDNPSNTGKPMGKGAVMVRFSSEELSESSAAGRGPVIQDGYIDIEIRFLVKDLRSHTGAYALMSATRQHLIGFKPESTALDAGYCPDVTGFQLVTGQLIEYEKGAALWDWGQMYRLPITYRGKTRHG